MRYADDVCELPEIESDFAANEGIAPLAQEISAPRPWRKSSLSGGDGQLSQAAFLRKFAQLDG